MIKEKEFEGYAITDGDDGYCFGVHAMLSSVPDIKSWSNNNSDEMISWLDEVFEDNQGKKVKVSIRIEVEEWKLKKI